MAKIQPAVSTILINIPANGSGYLDLSQCASIVNRRFYRQGLNWAVAGFRCNQQQGIAGGRFQIEKLPETWVMSNAWHKVFAAWLKQQNEALETSESAVAKFRDFKIHMDTTHVSDGFASNLLPIKTGGGTFTSGEWEPTQIVIPNADNPTGSEVGTQPAEYYLHMVGAGLTTTTRGMIAGYSYSRAVPTSPDPTLPDFAGFPNVTNENNWMRNMFDVGNDDQEVLENAALTNNDLPYPQNDYPGGPVQAPVLQLHAHTDISSTTSAVDNSFFMPGTQVPCGLLKFSNGTDQIMEVFIDLVPGHHRGYLCEPMQEF